MTSETEVLQAIVDAVVEELGYADAMVATLENGNALPVRAFAVDEAMRIIRDHGMRKGRRYWHDVVGYNFRLTNLQAAVGCGQLENLDVIISERKRVF